MKSTKTLVLAAFAMGLIAVVVLQLGSPTLLAEETGASAKPVDVAALKAEVDRLKGLVPDQAHAMMDVDYHFSNLWFAGQNENWDLAQFNVNEVRSHLRWAVRIIPVRKNAAGIEVFLEQLLGAVEAAQLEPLKKSVEAKDKVQFERAYKDMLNGCYMCHVASSKPYLRLHVPEKPSSNIVDFAMPK